MDLLFDIDITEESLERLESTLHEVFTRVMAGEKLAGSLDRLTKQLDTLSRLNLSGFLQQLSQAGTLLNNFEKSLKNELRFEVDVTDINLDAIDNIRRKLNTTFRESMSAADNLAEGISKSLSKTNANFKGVEVLEKLYGSLVDVKAISKDIKLGRLVPSEALQQLDKARGSANQLLKLLNSESWEEKTFIDGKVQSIGKAFNIDNVQREYKKVKDYLTQLRDEYHLLKTEAVKYNNLDLQGKSLQKSLSEYYSKPIEKYLENLAVNISEKAAKTPVKIPVVIDKVKIDGSKIQKELDKYLFNLPVKEMAAKAASHQLGDAVKRSVQEATGVAAAASADNLQLKDAIKSQVQEVARATSARADNQQIRAIVKTQLQEAARAATKIDTNIGTEIGKQIGKDIAINIETGIKENLAVRELGLEEYMMKSFPKYAKSPEIFKTNTKVPDFEMGGYLYKIRDELRKTSPELQKIISDMGNNIGNPLVKVFETLNASASTELSQLNKSILSTLFGDEILHKGVSVGKEAGQAYINAFNKSVKNTPQTVIGDVLKDNVLKNLDMDFIAKQMSQIPYTILNDANIGTLYKKIGKNEAAQFGTQIQAMFGAISKFEKSRFDTNALRNSFMEVSGVIKALNELGIKDRLLEDFEKLNTSADGLAAKLKSIDISKLGNAEQKQFNRYIDEYVNADKGDGKRLRSLFDEYITTDKLKQKYNELIGITKKFNLNPEAGEQAKQLMQNIEALEVLYASLALKMAEVAKQTPMPGREAALLGKAMVPLDELNGKYEQLNEQRQKGMLSTADMIKQLENYAKGQGNIASNIQAEIYSKGLQKEMVEPAFSVMLDKTKESVTGIMVHINKLKEGIPAEMVSSLTSMNGKLNLNIESLAQTVNIMKGIKDVNSFRGIIKQIDIANERIRAFGSNANIARKMYENPALYTPIKGNIVTQKQLKSDLKELERKNLTEKKAQEAIVEELKKKKALHNEVLKLQQAINSTQIAELKSSGLSGRFELNQLKEIAGYYNNSKNSVDNLIRQTELLYGSNAKNVGVYKEILAIQKQIKSVIEENAKRQGELNTSSAKFNLDKQMLVIDKYRDKANNSLTQVQGIGGPARLAAIKSYVNDAENLITQLKRYRLESIQAYGATHKTSEAYKNAGIEINKLSKAIERYNGEANASNKLANLQNKKYRDIGTGAKALARELHYAFTPLGMLNNTIRMMGHSFGSFFLYQRIFSSITRSVRTLINTMGEYEDKLLRVRGVTQSSSGNMALSMKSYANSVDKYLQKAPVLMEEVTATLYHIATSGISSAMSQIMLPDVQNFLIAVKGSLGEKYSDSNKMMQAFIKTYNIFGDEARRVNSELTASQYVASGLFAAYKRGDMTANQMAAGLKKAGNEAKAAKLSLAEFAGTVAYFNNKGLDDSRAGTAMRTMLGLLAKKQDDIAKIFPEFNNLPDSFGQVGDESYYKNFIRTLGKIAETYQQTGRGGYELQGKVADLFQIRSKAGIQTILLDYQNLLEIIKEIENNSGNWNSIMDQVDARTNSIKGQMNIMQNLSQQIQKELLSGLMGHDDMISGFKAVNDLLLTIRDNAFRAGNVIREVGIGLFHLFSFQLQYQALQFFSGITQSVASLMGNAGLGKMLGPVVGGVLSETISQAAFGTGFLDSIGGMLKQLGSVKDAINIGTRPIELGFVEELALQYERINELKGEGKRIEDDTSDSLNKQRKSIEKLLLFLSPTSKGSFRSSFFSLSGLFEKNPEETLNAIDDYYKKQMDMVDEKGSLAKEKMIASNGSSMKELLDSFVQNAAHNMNVINNQVKSLSDNKVIKFGLGYEFIPPDKREMYKELTEFLKNNPVLNSDIDMGRGVNPLKLSLNTLFNFDLNKVKEDFKNVEGFYSNFASSLGGVLGLMFNEPIKSMLYDSPGEQLKAAIIESYRKAGKEIPPELEKIDLDQYIESIDSISSEDLVSITVLPENYKNYIEDVKSKLINSGQLSSSQQTQLKQIAIKNQRYIDEAYTNMIPPETSKGYLPDDVLLEYKTSSSGILESFTDEVYRLLLTQADFFDRYSASIDKAGIAEKLKLEIERLKEIKNYVDKVFSGLPKMEKFDIFDNAKYDLQKLLKGQVEPATPDIMFSQQIQSLNEHYGITLKKQEEQKKKLKDVKDLFGSIINRTGKLSKALSSDIKDKTLLNLLERQKQLTTEINNINSKQDKSTEDLDNLELLNSELETVSARLYSSDYMLKGLFDTLRSYEATEGISLLPFQDEKFSADDIITEINKLKRNVLDTTGDAKEEAKVQYQAYTDELLSYFEQVGQLNTANNTLSLFKDIKVLSTDFSGLKDIFSEIGKTDIDRFGDRFVLSTGDLKKDWNQLSTVIQDNQLKLANINKTYSKQLSLVDNIATTYENIINAQYDDENGLQNAKAGILMNLQGAIKSISQSPLENQQEFINQIAGLGTEAGNSLILQLKEAFASDGLSQEELTAFFMGAVNDEELFQSLIEKLKTAIKEGWDNESNAQSQENLSNLYEKMLNNMKEMASEMDKFDTQFTTLTISGRKLSKSNIFVKMAKSAKGAFRDIAWGVNVLDKSVEGVNKLTDGFENLKSVFDSQNTAGLLEGLMTGLGGLSGMASGVLGIFTSVFDFFDDKSENAQKQLDALSRIAEERYNQFSEERVTADYGLSHTVYNQNTINYEFGYLLPNEDALEQSAHLIGGALQEYGYIPERDGG